MLQRPDSLSRRHFMVGAAAATTALAIGCSGSDDRDGSSDPVADTSGLVASWWSVPRAVEVGGRTFAGGTSSMVKEGFEIGSELNWDVLGLPTLDPGGTVSVIELGVPERHVIHQGNSDDHNTPTLLIPEDRPPLVFTTQHNATDTILYRKGTTPLELSTLGPVQEIDLTSTGGKVTYTQAYRTGSTDQVTAFSRCGKHWWIFVRSDDWGVTWQPPPRLLAYGPNPGYMNAAQVGNNLPCPCFGIVVLR